jgi:hypothetical protein
MGPEDGIWMVAPPRLALNAAQWVSVGRVVINRSQRNLKTHLATLSHPTRFQNTGLEVSLYTV